MCWSTRCPLTSRLGAALVIGASFTLLQQRWSSQPKLTFFQQSMNVAKANAAPVRVPEHVPNTAEAPRTAAEHVAKVTEAPVTVAGHVPKAAEAPSTAAEHAAHATEAPVTVAEQVQKAEDAPFTAADALLDLFMQVCRWGTQIRQMSNDQREQLINIMAPAVGAPPAVGLSRYSRVKPFRTDCKNPDWYPSLLSGEREPRHIPMIDAVSGVGGGAELELLEIRFLELLGVVDYFVVAESAFNFRGDTKPRLFEKNKMRFEAFLDRIVHLDLDKCEPYRVAVDEFRRKPPNQKPKDVWGIQSAQRNCIWTLLRHHKNISSDTLVIHTDLDEIPTAEAMWSLRNCKWSDPGPKVRYHDIVQLHLLPVTYNLRTLHTVPSDDWVQGTVRKFSRITISPKYWNEKPVIGNDFGVIACLRCAGTLNMRRAGVHLQSTTNLAQLYYKFIQHGEGGGLSAPVLNIKEGQTSFCNMRSREDVVSTQALLQDNPSGWLNPKSKSLPLPQRAPEMQVLERCLVPWAVLENRERYPFFWGTGRLQDITVDVKQQKDHHSEPPENRGALPNKTSIAQPSNIIPYVQAQTGEAHDHATDGHVREWVESKTNLTLHVSFVVDDSANMGRLLMDLNLFKFCFQEIFLTFDIPHGGCNYGPVRLRGGPETVSKFLHSHARAELLQEADRVLARAVAIHRRHCANQVVTRAEIIDYESDEVHQLWRDWFFLEFEPPAPAESKWPFAYMWKTQMMYVLAVVKAANQFVLHVDDDIAVVDKANNGVGVFVQAAIEKFQASDTVVLGSLGLCDRQESKNLVRCGANRGIDIFCSSKFVSTQLYMTQKSRFAKMRPLQYWRHFSESSLSVSINRKNLSSVLFEVPGICKSQFKHGAERTPLTSEEKAESQFVAKKFSSNAMTEKMSGKRCKFR